MYSRILPGRLNRRSPPTGKFSGNFASILSGAYQVIQSDLGLTYGSTPLANSTNTSTTVLSLTGSLSTAPVPIWFKATNSAAVGAGAQFNVYYDGTGTTPAMTGVTPSVGVAVPLTGAATGLSNTWAAGNGVANDIWKATSAANADQSGNGVHATQGTLGAQPVIGIGVNGRVSLIFDGIDDFMTSTFGALPTDVQVDVVMKCDFTGTNTRVLIGGNSNSCLIGNLIASDHAAMYMGGGGVSATGDDNVSRALIVVSETSAGGTAIQWGGQANNTAIAPVAAPGLTRFIGRQNAAFPRNAGAEVFLVAYTPIGGTSTLRAAINSPAGYGAGNILV